MVFIERSEAETVSIIINELNTSNNDITTLFRDIGTPYAGIEQHVYSLKVYRKFSITLQQKMLYSDGRRCFN